MKGSISSHAVVCGLVCASTVVFPPLACAQAPAQGNPSLLLSEAYMNFGLGFLAGVGISGLITTIGIMIYAHRREVRAAEDIEFETCVFTPSRATSAASADVSTNGYASAPTSKNASVAPTSSAATTSPAVTSASTSTSTPASAPAPAVPESCGVLSQASSSANSLRARLSQIPQVDAPLAMHPDTSKASQQASQKSEQQASQKASHLTNSLEDFAEHYAQHERDRKSA